MGHPREFGASGAGDGHRDRGRGHPRLALRQRSCDARAPSGPPDEIANAVLFLACDESGYVNATELVVDGGAVAIGLGRVRKLLEEDYDKAHGAQ